MNLPPQGRPQLLAPSFLTCAPDAITFRTYEAAESTGTHGHKGEQPFQPPLPDCACETLVLYRKRADEKAVGQREGPDGALSIQPFERSRVTTLWDLSRVFRAMREGGARERGV